MPNIRKSYERKRGCGFRKGGGFYFRLEGTGYPCGFLPIPLIACTCCGIKPEPSRGIQWLSTSYLKFVSEKSPCDSPLKKCIVCPMTQSIFDQEKIALDWVGASFYPTTDKFHREASQVGISRRLAAKILADGTINIGLKGFKVGVDWVALAHKKAIVSISETGDYTRSQGIFKLFRPEKIEYVVKGDESEEFLEILEEQGFELVEVINQDFENKQLFE